MSFSFLQQLSCIHSARDHLVKFHNCKQEQNKNIPKSRGSSEVSLIMVRNFLLLLGFYRIQWKIGLCTGGGQSLISRPWKHDAAKGQCQKYLTTSGSRQIHRNHQAAPHNEEYTSKHSQESCRWEIPRARASVSPGRNKLQHLFHCRLAAFNPEHYRTVSLFLSFPEWVIFQPANSGSSKSLNTTFESKLTRIAPV